VLFLDEPTIGLDVTMQKRIRLFIAEYNRRTGATVLLTSHYMADVEALCRRVIVIHRGHLLFDGDLSRLAQQFAAHQTVSVRLDSPAADLSAYGEVIGHEDGKVHLRIPKADTSRVTAQLLQTFTVTELTIEDPPVEDAIERVFADELPEEAA
jgi:ABC-2 type transport system ATP-binding protein